MRFQNGFFFFTSFFSAAAASAEAAATFFLLDEASELLLELEVELLLLELLLFSRFPAELLEDTVGSFPPNALRISGRERSATPSFPERVPCESDNSCALIVGTSFPPPVMPITDGVLGCILDASSSWRVVDGAEICTVVLLIVDVRATLTSLASRFSSVMAVTFGACCSGVPEPTLVLAAVATRARGAEAAGRSARDSGDGAMTDATGGVFGDTPPADEGARAADRSSRSITAAFMLKSDDDSVVVASRETAMEWSATPVAGANARGATGCNLSSAAGVCGAVYAAGRGVLPCVLDEESVVEVGGGAITDVKSVASGVTTRVIAAGFVCCCTVGTGCKLGL